MDGWSMSSSGENFGVISFINLVFMNEMCLWENVVNMSVLVVVLFLSLIWINEILRWEFI